MKNVVPVLLSIALIAASTSAMAEGESVDLTVTGSVVPSACVPALDNGGKLDWGTIPSSSLKEDDLTYLDHKNLKLTIACAASTQFGVQIVDNRAESAADENGARGLGFAGETEFPIGAYYLYQRESTADGNPAGALLSSDKGETWVLGGGLSGAPIKSTDWVGIATAQATPLTPSFATNAVINFTARGYISGKNHLPPIGEEDIALDGSSTFEIKYL